MLNIIMYMFFTFIIYSFLGFLCEVIYVGILTGKMTNRGFMFGPQVPIYAFGAFIVGFPVIFKGVGINLNLPWLDSVIDHPEIWYNWFIMFGIGFVLTTTLEYFTSFVMEKLFHIRLWDYSKRWLNINGRVCLRNSTLFGLMILLMIYLIGPHVGHIVMRFLAIDKWSYIIFGAIVALAIADFTFALVHHINIAKIMIKIEKAAKEAENGVNNAMKKVSELATNNIVISRMSYFLKTNPTVSVKSKVVNGRASFLEYAAKVKEKVLNGRQ